MDAERAAEIRSKLGALSRARFGRLDWPALFAAYAGSDNHIGEEECTQLFADAEIGGLLRSRWVDGVYGALDRDHDRRLSRTELDAALRSGGAPPPPSPTGARITSKLPPVEVSNPGRAPAERPQLGPLVLLLVGGLVALIGSMGRR